jgi:hypothetical protein
MQLIRKILDLINNIKEIPCTNPAGSDLNEGDRVIGTLSDELKKFYLVWVSERGRLDAGYAELNAKLNIIGDPMKATESEQRCITQEHYLIRNRYDIITNLFIFALKRSFPVLLPLANSDIEDNVYVLKDWRIAIKRNCNPAIERDFIIRVNTS